MAAQRTYVSFVEEQSRQNPSLLNLNVFLRTHHRIACSISCLDFCNGSPSQVRPCELDAVSLNRVLAGFRHGRQSFHTIGLNGAVNHVNHSTRIAGRIILIEDLTAEIIEVLGSNLDIDPLFFSSHIYTAEKKLGSQSADGPNLPSRYEDSNFMNLHYHRTLELTNEYKPKGNTVRNCNVPRKFAVLPKVKGTYFALTQHCCSVLKTVNHQKQWLGTCP